MTGITVTSIRLLVLLLRVRGQVMTKRMDKVEMGKQDERLLRQVLFQSLLASKTAYLNFIM